MKCSDRDCFVVLFEGDTIKRRFEWRTWAICLLILGRFVFVWPVIGFNPAPVGWLLILIDNAIDTKEKGKIERFYCWKRVVVMDKVVSNSLTDGNPWGIPEPYIYNSPSFSPAFEYDNRPFQSIGTPHLSFVSSVYSFVHQFIKNYAMHPES